MLSINILWLFVALCLSDTALVGKTLARLRRSSSTHAGAVTRERLNHVLALTKAMLGWPPVAQLEASFCIVKREGGEARPGDAKACISCKRCCRGEAMLKHVLAVRG